MGCSTSRRFRFLAPGWEIETFLCHPALVKFVLAIIIVAMVVGSFIADYHWRKWIKSRKRDRE